MSVSASITRMSYGLTRRDVLMRLSSRRGRKIWIRDGIRLSVKSAGMGILKYFFM
jgi:hypothetical protein